MQVDQGGFVDQTTYQPGAVHTRLAWQPSACVVDPVTGRPRYQRGGLAWVPMQAPGTYKVARVWQPNIVTRAGAANELVPRTVARNVPVQTCRMVRKKWCAECRCRFAAWCRKRSCAACPTRFAGR